MNTPSQELLGISYAYVAGQALYVAAELGIADLLRDGSRTIEQLAETSHTDPEALYRVLRFLASKGIFLEGPPRHFTQTKLSDALRADAPSSPRDVIRMISGEPYTAFGQLLYTVRTGKTAFDYVFGMPRFEWLASHPEKADLFQRAMVSLSQGANAEAAEAYDFTECRRVVDVGGGHGQLLSEIVTRNPHITGVLYDLADGIAAARVGIGGQLPRCELVAGDFFENVPEAADAYILKKVIHDWDDERAEKILENCRRAMAPEGKVLVVETIMSAGNEPDPIKTFDLIMLVAVGGRERTRDQYERLFARAGLRLRQVIPAGSTLSILEAVAD
jgi:SAM-dependent methyltransferase